ncbi:ATP synthase subunit delta', mitochondrial-like [Salvia divinorum]|uniref:ATP synthase subunit delta', mitochondrial-like n=1 Tax=Salvia divinorum TaxID=28513 RepID=A0ABD1FMI6_SALDI
MLRHGSRSLFGRASATSMRWRRLFSTDLPVETAEDTKFVESWKKMNPNMDPPKTPSAYMKLRPPTPANIPSKLTVNLVLPYDSVLSSKEVDMVIVPATTGQMGVLPGHVATIAELKPGILSVHEDIIAIEATPIDRLDPSLVQKGLADFQQKLNTASTDVEKAEAQIGIDVHSALNAALTG